MHSTWHVQVRRVGVGLGIPVGYRTQTSESVTLLRRGQTSNTRQIPHKALRHRCAVPSSRNSTPQSPPNGATSSGQYSQYACTNAYKLCCTTTILYLVCGGTYQNKNDHGGTRQHLCGVSLRTVRDRTRRRSRASSTSTHDRSTAPPYARVSINGRFGSTYTWSSTWAVC